MPANISTVSGKPEIAYFGEVPWHGLGTELSNPATAEEAIVAASLNWEVAVAKIQAIGLGDPIGISGHFATVRMDHKIPLGIVGRLYTPVQNKDAFSFFDSVVGQKAAMYHVAGALGKDETVWILAKLPEGIRIIGTDDIINKFLLLTNTHDGSRSLRMFFTPIRVVCQNTLSAALSVRKAGEGIVIRHFPDILKKVEQAKKALSIATDYYKDLSEAFNALARVEIDAEWLSEYVCEIMPSAKEGEVSTRLENIRDGMVARFESPANSLPGIKGTAWAAYNSVTEYVDHIRSIPKVDQDVSRRLQSVWMGSGAKIKESALNIALKKIGVVHLPQVKGVVIN
jgi:phage/plasmid-like protein (TIGR03299 family)